MKQESVNGKRQEWRRVNDNPAKRVVAFSWFAEVALAIQEVFGNNDGGSKSCRQASMHALR